MNLLKEHYQSDDAITYEMTDAVIEELEKWHKKYRYGPYTVDHSTVETVYDENDKREFQGKTYYLTKLGYKFKDTNGKEHEKTIKEWDPFDEKNPANPIFKVLVEYGKRPDNIKKFPSNRTKKIHQDSEDFIPVLVNFFVPDYLPKGKIYSMGHSKFRVWKVNDYYAGEVTVEKYLIDIEVFLDIKSILSQEYLPLGDTLWDDIQKHIRHEFTHFRQLNRKIKARWLVKEPRGKAKEWDASSDDLKRIAIDNKNAHQQFHYLLIPSEIEANLEACMSIARRRGFPLADVLFDYFVKFHLDGREDKALEAIEKYREYAERNYPEFEKF